MRRRRDVGGRRRRRKRGRRPRKRRKRKANTGIGTKKARNTTDTAAIEVSYIYVLNEPMNLLKDSIS